MCSYVCNYVHRLYLCDIIRSYMAPNKVKLTHNTVSCKINLRSVGEFILVEEAIS